VMTSAVVSLSEFFGFNPASPYADLFTQIYHLTKVDTVGKDIGSGHDDVEEEDGEIVECEVDDNQGLDHEEQVPEASHPNHEQLTGDVDFQPPLVQLPGGEIQHQPLDNWKEGWMKISRDAISWNQSNNQNQNMMRNSPWNKQMQMPPPPPQFQQLPGTNQPNGSIFQGTNQINSSIFTSGGSPLNFSLPPPPPIQLQSWNQNQFFLPPSSQAGYNFPVLNPNPLNFPPPPIHEQARGGVSVAPDEKEILESKGFDLRRQFDLDDNPVRKSWLIKYMEFQANRGTPLTSCPAMYREPLDLFKLFHVVMEEGGFANCSVKKAWKKVCVKMTANHRQPFLWRLLQKLYRKLLLQFENFETGRPEDLSRTGEERNERQDSGERKVLLPLPVSQAGGQQWGGAGGGPGAQWGALSASYSMDEAGQDMSRGAVGKKGKKKGAKGFNKAARRT